MQRKTKGQSLVEMALVLPIILVVVFGIIDFGWYIYGYATIYQAARNGAEKASMLPPMENRVGANRAPDRNDANCVGSIINSIRTTAPLFDDLTAPASDAIRISYPSGRRAVGEQIEIRVTYRLTPLTPLWQLVSFNNSGTIPMNVVTRRSIDVLGANPQNRYAPNLTACN